MQDQEIHPVEESEEGERVTLVSRPPGRPRPAESQKSIPPASETTGASSAGSQATPSSTGQTTIAVDRVLLGDMAAARQVVTLGHALRSASDIKVRQPLGRALTVADAAQRAGIARLADIVADELNVKTVEFRLPRSTTKR